MKHWEYIKKRVDYNDSDQVLLEEYGRKGWEAWHYERVCSLYSLIYFKRAV